MCSIYSCWLERLTPMRECKLTVLSWRSGAATTLCIDRFSCLLKPFHEAISNNSRATIHLCCAYYSRYGTCQKPLYAHFDLHVALVQYTSRTLFVDFRCSDSKDSSLVCLHIQNIVMIIFQTKQCSFTFFQRY